MDTDDRIRAAETALDGRTSAAAVSGALDEMALFKACGDRYAMAVAIRRFLSAAGHDPATVAEDYIAGFETAYAATRADA